MKPKRKISATPSDPQVPELPASLPETSEPAAPQSPIPLSRQLFLRIAVCAAALYTVYIVFRCYSPLPKADQWDEVQWLNKYYANLWHIGDLWRQHNEHRILFPRLFILTDLLVFHGRNVFLFFSMLAMQAAHCWLFCRQAKREAGLSPGEKLFLWSAFVLLFFSAGHLDNFTWAFQVSFILVFLAATASLQCLLESAASGKSESLGAYAWLAASIAAATVASYSLASGILIWPTLVLLAIGLRLPLHRIAILAASGALVVWVFFLDYHSLPGHTNAQLALHQPLDMIYYAAAFLAIPVSRLNHDLGVTVGLLQMLFTTWLVIRLLMGRIVSRKLYYLALGNMVFIVATAFLTAAGRMALGDPEEVARYITPSLLFWVGFITVCLMEREILPWNPRGRLAIVASITVTWLILAIVPITLSETKRLTRLAVPVWDAETALLVNVRNEERLNILYPSTLPSDLVPLMQVHKLSIFSDGAAQVVGRRLTEMFEVSPGSSACRGAVEFTEPVSGQPGADVRLTGWAWDATRNRLPRRILMVSGDYIQGLGQFTRERTDVEDAFHSSRMESSGWFGYMHAPAAGKEYTAYAVLGDGRSVCVLPNPLQLKRQSLAVFRNGTWYIGAMDGAGVRQTRTFNFGLAGDKPVAGDWDGSGVVRAGVYRNGTWYLDWNNNGAWDDGDRIIPFGQPGDLPVVADWNGSGKTKLGLFRNGTWILDWDGSRKIETARMFHFGLPGDLPVVGDWDGSGMPRIGVYRPALGLWYLDTGNFEFDGSDKIVRFGLGTDQPVAGDWSGLKRYKVGVFRSGQWLLDYNGNRESDPDDKTLPFGLPGDLAVPW